MRFWGRTVEVTSQLRASADIGVDEFLAATIEGEVRAAGFAPVPKTVTVEWVEPVVLTDWQRDHDIQFARVVIGCAE